MPRRRNKQRESLTDRIFLRVKISRSTVLFLNVLHCWQTIAGTVLAHNSAWSGFQLENYPGEGRGGEGGMKQFLIVVFFYFMGSDC